MENIKLICKDCGKEFDFTVGEQRFYEEKGFDFEAILKKFQENTIKFDK